LIDNIHITLSIEDALARLASWRGTAQQIAPRIASGELLDRLFFSISHILILRRIVVDDRVLQIGAAVTFNQMAGDPLVLIDATSFPTG
jgi:hypothetical protein